MDLQEIMRKYFRISVKGDDTVEQLKEAARRALADKNDAAAKRFIDEGAKVIMDATTGAVVCPRWWADSRPRASTVSATRRRHFDRPPSSAPA